MLALCLVPRTVGCMSAMRAELVGRDREVILEQLRFDKMELKPWIVLLGRQELPGKCPLLR